jgi:hypothetical protein
MLIAYATAERALASDLGNGVGPYARRYLEERVGLERTRLDEEVKGRHTNPTK